MEIWTIWLLLAVFLIVGEMLTGTFYLLGFGSAVALGGMVAWFGGPLSLQLSVVAIITIIFWGWVRNFKKKLLQDTNDEFGQIDIGNLVQWLGEKENGVWQVRYRGTVWDAIPARKEVSSDRELYIVSMKGSQLVVDNSLNLDRKNVEVL